MLCAAPLMGRASPTPVRPGAPFKPQASWPMWCCFLCSVLKTWGQMPALYSLSCYEKVVGTLSLNGVWCCRYVRYFAASLASMPQQRRVCLKAVSVGGWNWLGRGQTAVKVRCRPTGASEAAKVARFGLDDKRHASCGECWLEGDLKFEVCVSSFRPLHHWHCVLSSGMCYVE